jgi:hypothetical protein
MTDERTFLENINAARSKFDENAKLQEQRKKDVAALESFLGKLNDLADQHPEHVELIKEEIAAPLVEMGRQPEPELPVKNIVNKSVEFLAKTKPQNIQQAADSLPNGVRKELDIIKKSITDLHRFASRHSQMGGGGEVNLRYLDDIDRSSIMQGRFLTYDNATKKFKFTEISEYIGGSYISTYYNGANVSIANTAEAYIVPIGTNFDTPRNISVGSNNSFNISHTGKFVLNYSLQLMNKDSELGDVYIWLKLNGNNIEDTSSVFTVPFRKNSSTFGKLIATTPIYFSANTGDAVQVMMAAPDSTANTISLVTFEAITSPAIPQTPAALMSITEIL